jgi:hypothetical protein
MTGINSAVTGKFSDPPVIMTGITSRFISRPAIQSAGLSVVYTDIGDIC